MKIEHFFSLLKNCNRRYVDVYESKQVRGLLDLLYREGRIRYYSVIHPKKIESARLRVFLKSKLTQPIKLATKVKHSLFVNRHQLNPHSILSTSSFGICSGKEARKRKIGGTLLSTL